MRKLVNETLLELSDVIPYSKKAEDLVCGTIGQESDNGEFREQTGGGPALGITQMEPDTFRDIIDNYLEYRPHIWNRIAQISGVLSPNPNDLIHNDKLAICMCRVQYYRQKEQIPDTLNEQANFYKKYYNTPKGKATPEEYIKKYNLYFKE